MIDAPYKMIGIRNETITEALETKYKIPIVYGENEDPALNDYEYFYYLEDGIYRWEQGAKKGLYQRLFIFHVSKLTDTELEIDIMNTLHGLGLNWKNTVYQRWELGDTKKRVHVAIHEFTRPVKGACI